MSRYTWEFLKDFLQGVTHEKNPVPSAVIAIQTFGDVLGFNPHCHILITDDCFYETLRSKVLKLFAEGLEKKK